MEYFQYAIQMRRYNLSLSRRASFKKETNQLNKIIELIKTNDPNNF